MTSAILERKKEETTTAWKTLQDKELHNVYTSPKISERKRNMEAMRRACSSKRK
jgi:hypothetical protein